MSEKVKPWHQRKPKQHDKNRRPKHKKDAYCPPIDGEDVDEGGSMLGRDMDDDDDRWES